MRTLIRDVNTSASANTTNTNAIATNKNTINKNTIKDACISVGLRDEVFESLRESLWRILEHQGLGCERVGAVTHVSVAYTQGESEVGTIEEVATRIASRSFFIQGKGLGILEGRTTPYDYLVLEVDGGDAFASAIDLIGERFSIRRFEEGFKSHISLLRFPKGALSARGREGLVHELAEQALIIGSNPCLCFEGECVRVFNPNHEVCLQVRFRETSLAAA